MSFGVNTEVLRRVATDWDGLAEHVARAVRRLRTCETAATGRPSAELDTFLDTWITRAGRVADSAQQHADTLRTAASTYDASDVAAQNALVRLLPRDGQLP